MRNSTSSRLTVKTWIAENAVSD